MAFDNYYDKYYADIYGWGNKASSKLDSEILRIYDKPYSSYILNDTSDRYLPSSIWGDFENDPSIYSDITVYMEIKNSDYPLTISFLENNKKNINWDDVSRKQPIDMIDKNFISKFKNLIDFDILLSREDFSKDIIIDNYVLFPLDVIFDKLFIGETDDSGKEYFPNKEFFANYFKKILSRIDDKNIVAGLVKSKMDFDKTFIKFFINKSNLNKINYILSFFTEKQVDRFLSRLFLYTVIFGTSDSIANFIFYHFKNLEIEYINNKAKEEEIICLSSAATARLNELIMKSKLFNDEENISIFKEIVTEFKFIFEKEPMKYKTLVLLLDKNDTEDIDWCDLFSNPKTFYNIKNKNIMKRFLFENINSIEKYCEKSKKNSELLMYFSSYCHFDSNSNFDGSSFFESIMPGFLFLFQNEYKEKLMDKSYFEPTILKYANELFYDFEIDDVLGIHLLDHLQNQTLKENENFMDL